MSALPNERSIRCHDEALGEGHKGPHTAVINRAHDTDVAATVMIPKYVDFELVDLTRLAGDVLTIFIPHHTSARRDRFTKAHELGHYFLHYLYPKVSGEARFGRGARDRAETEANVFASALLMPSEQFKRAYAEVGGDVWQLASRFDVSPRAAEVRAEVLGLR